MKETIDLTKILNSHIKPLEFEIIEGALKGDIECMHKVVDYYQPYLRKLATKELYDAEGKKYYVMDESVRCQLENKLMTSVLKFNLEKKDK